MTLSKKQFDILVYLEGKKVAASQREIAAGTGFSLGTVNKILTEFSENGLISGGAVTEVGIKAL